MDILRLGHFPIVPNIYFNYLIVNIFHLYICHCQTGEMKQTDFFHSSSSFKKINSEITQWFLNIFQPKFLVPNFLL